MLQEKVIGLFRNKFRSEPELIVRAPGRINLIGEHTDYNMGWVLPAAINKNTFFAFESSDEDKYYFSSSSTSEIVSFDSTSLNFSAESWTKYFSGILDLLMKDGYVVKGFKLAFAGDIPIGAGLSSSASLCCGFIYGLNILKGFNLSYEKMAYYAQKAEHIYAGLNCGLMDQYAVLFSKANSFLKLDCRSMDIEYIPSHLEGYTIVLCNSGVKHELAESEYNVRRAECEEGIKTLCRFFKTVHACYCHVARHCCLRIAYERTFTISALHKSKHQCRIYFYTSQ